jgi:hypothetical protein
MSVCVVGFDINAYVFTNNVGAEILLLKYKSSTAKHVSIVFIFPV